jgi:hypothetical protein
VTAFFGWVDRASDRHGPALQSVGKASVNCGGFCVRFLDGSFLGS